MMNTICKWARVNFPRRLRRGIDEFSTLSPSSSFLLSSLSLVSRHAPSRGKKPFPNKVYLAQRCVHPWPRLLSTFKPLGQDDGNEKSGDDHDKESDIDANDEENGDDDDDVVEDDDVVDDEEEDEIKKDDSIKYAFEVMLDRSHWRIHPQLERYITAPSDGPLGRIHGPQFYLTFLGTGSGSPSIKRGCTSTALGLGGNTYIFDAGEGVQRQTQIARGVRLGNVTRIFITHLHGDHIFGLPGLLLNLQSIVKQKKQQMGKNFDGHSIQIYGPVGLFNFVAATISLSATELKTVAVDVYELTGGSRHFVHPGSLVDYPEFRQRGLRRKAIPQNKDGTWTLEEPHERQTPDDVVKYSACPKGLYVKAAQVFHVTKLQCFGYVIQEPLRQAQTIDVERALAAGVAPGRVYQLLKAGFPVPSDDGSRIVHPSEVLKDEPPNISRKVAILGDCCAVPRPMLDLCMDADALVHEATFSKFDHGNTVEHRGHSTAHMAGRVAALVRAKVLLLNHISPIYQHPEFAARLVEEAEKAVRAENASTKVQITYDLMDFHIPRKGLFARMFKKNDETNSCAASNESGSVTQESLNVNGKQSEDIASNEYIAPCSKEPPQCTELNTTGATAPTTVAATCDE